MIDKKDSICSICGKGTNIETSIYDDMDGVLHCSHCNNKINRYIDAPTISIKKE